MFSLPQNCVHLGPTRERSRAVTLGRRACEVSWYPPPSPWTLEVSGRYPQISTDGLASWCFLVQEVPGVARSVGILVSIFARAKWPLWSKRHWVVLLQRHTMHRHTEHTEHTEHTVHIITSCTKCIDRPGESLGQPLRTGTLQDFQWNKHPPGASSFSWCKR